MMSNGSVASVIVMARFILRDMYRRASKVMIIGDSILVGYVVELNIWGTFEM